MNKNKKNNPVPSKNKGTKSAISLSMSGLADFAQSLDDYTIPDHIIKEEEVQKNPDMESKKQKKNVEKPKVVNVTGLTNENWERFLENAAGYKTTENKDWKLMSIRRSTFDTLDRLKMIPELKSMPYGNMLSALLDIFVADNKDFLQKKLVENLDKYSF